MVRESYCWLEHCSLPEPVRWFLGGRVLEGRSRSREASGYSIIGLFFSRMCFKAVLRYKQALLAIRQEIPPNLPWRLE